MGHKLHCLAPTVRDPFLFPYAGARPFRRARYDKPTCEHAQQNGLKSTVVWNKAVRKPILRLELCGLPLCGAVVLRR